MWRCGYVFNGPVPLFIDGKLNSSGCNEVACCAGLGRINMAKHPNKIAKVLSHLEEERFLTRLESKEKRKARNRRESSRTVTTRVKSRFEQESDHSQPNSIRAKKRRVEAQVDPSYRQLKLPSIIDLVSNYEETVELIGDIRRIALKERSPIYLNFDELIEISPTGLLLLLSEIHRTRLLHGQSHVYGNYPKDARIEKLLAESGFFELLGIRSRKKPSKRTYPLARIPFVSNTKLATGEPRKLREELLGDAITIHPKIRSRLYRALTEAMINVGQHAYPEGTRRLHATRGRWWLAGHFNKKKQELQITFSDLGVGIPETLPKMYAWEVIWAALSLIPGIKPHDGEMIMAGMVIGRSRTGQSHRGKGLNDLRSLIEQAGAGELLIFSRKGMYQYNPDSGEKTKNFSRSIGGTLIKWTLPLNRVTDWLSDEQELVDD